MQKVKKNKQKCIASVLQTYIFKLMNLLDIPILKRLFPSIIRRYLMLIGKYQIKIKINNFIFEIDIRESIERKTYFISCLLYTSPSPRDTG